MSKHHTKNKPPKAWKWLHEIIPEQLWLRRTILSIVVVLTVVMGIMFSIGQWYIHTQSKNQTLGTSFIPDYAQSLGVDPKKTMDALLSINVKNIRLVSYWSDMETTKGQYNFEQLDWQFQKAEAANAKVILTVGLRQPRWPECHAPDWVATEPRSQWQPELLNFMTAVVNRYKNSPSLDKYQVENEFFLKGFGSCTDFSRDRLVAEYNLVKKQDPKHQIIVARSNNALGFPVGEPKPDLFSVSVYKRVWDAGFTHRYLEYPQTPWFYAFLAGTQKIFLHRDMIVGELQAEAWPPNGKQITDISLDEQNKSFSPERFKERIEYGKETGMSAINLWGAEYWYYRKEKLHDDSLWNIARYNFNEQAMDKDTGK